MATPGLRWRCTAHLALSALFLGCTPTHSGADGQDESPLGLDDYLTRSGEAACAAHLRCTDRWNNAVGTDTERCHPAFVSRANQRMSDAVAQERARFDANRAVSALTRLENPDCDALGSFGRDWLADVRDEGLVGLRALGETCLESFECQSAQCGDRHCVQPEPPPSRERWPADVAEGNVCGERRCAAGLRCVGAGETSAVCVRALAPAERCDPTGRCPHGFTCTDRGCAAMPTVGTPCDPQTSPCLEGICEDGQCRPGNESESCSENEQLAFLDAGSKACAPGLRCDLSRLQCFSPPPDSERSRRGRGSDRAAR